MQRLPPLFLAHFGVSHLRDAIVIPEKLFSFFADKAAKKENHIHSGAI
jgi:hypothetical protein